MSAVRPALRIQTFDRRRKPAFDSGVILVGRGLLLIAILSVVAWWVL